MANGSDNAGFGGRGSAALEAALLALLAAGCGGGADGPPADVSAERGGDRPAVVVSVPPLAWFVDRLSEGRVDASVMVPPGASPATYEPTARQMRVVARADLYVAVGHPRFPFEAAWLDALSAANPGMEVVRAGATCSTLPDDPHLWLSTECAGRMAGRIGRALERLSAGPARAWARRVEAVRAAVDSVDAELARRLEPYRGRAFLVLHPALGYVARRFDLRQVAVARGPSGPGPGALAGIIRTAREAGIQTVFVQPQFSRVAADVVARELPGGRVATVDPLARDWAAGMTGIGRALEASFRRSAATPDPGTGPAAVRAGPRPGSPAP